MKTRNVPLEANYWASEQINSPHALIDTFFTYDSLSNYKDMLGEVIFYACETKVYKQDYPGQVFSLYLCLRSFIRACYHLQFIDSKSTETSSSQYKAYLNSDLTKEEYDNSFLVFQNAFQEVSIWDFDFFLSECVHLSLTPHSVVPSCNVCLPLQHLIKMLDAAQIIQKSNTIK